MLLDEYTTIRHNNLRRPNKQGYSIQYVRKTPRAVEIKRAALAAKRNLSSFPNSGATA